MNFHVFPESIDYSAQIEALKRQLLELSRENAVLRYQRDVARSEASSLLPKATAAEEMEVRRIKDVGVSNGLSQLIADLETRVAQ